MAGNGSVFIFLLVGVIVAGGAAGQDCGCPPSFCCSQWGYCGKTDAYCGDGCQEGPCKVNGGGGGTSVEKVVTETFFDGIKSRISSSCAGKSFYTRTAFINALKSYPRFGNEGTDLVAKREIAAMFAHYTHETGHFCYKGEINGATRNDGWGPILQLWNYNSFGFDGLNAPETVARNAVVAFKTGLSFWMNNVHSIIVSGQGFGATIRAINGMECNGGNSDAVGARVEYYRDYCQQFNVTTGDNLYC